MTLTRPDPYTDLVCVSVLDVVVLDGAGLETVDQVNDDVGGRDVGVVEAGQLRLLTTLLQLPNKHSGGR